MLCLQNKSIATIDKFVELNRLIVSSFNNNNRHRKRAGFTKEEAEFKHGINDGLY